MTHVANAPDRIEDCADEVTSHGMAILLITEDGVITPDELRHLQASGRALLGVGRLLERVAVGAHLIAQIWRLGLENAPNTRLQRRIRQVQALLSDPADPASVQTPDPGTQRRDPPCKP